MAEQGKDGTQQAEVEVVGKEPAGAPAGGGEAQLVLARDVLPDQLPVIAVERPLFPGMTVPMLVEEEPARQAVAGQLQAQRKHVALLLRKPGPADRDGVRPPARASELHAFGVVGEIRQAAQLAPAAPLQLLVSIRERLRVERFLREGPPVVARVAYVAETDMTPNEELKAYALSVVNSIKELVKMNPLHKEELSILMSRSNLGEPGRLADIAAALTSAESAELQDVLETLSIRQRLRKVLWLLRKEIDLSALQAKIGKQIEERLTRQQREFFLREQLKAIKKELGLAKEGKEAEVERFEARRKDLKLTDEARARVDEELDKLRLIEPASPEFHVARNYVDWLTAMPWGVFTEDRCELGRAKRVLDRDHYGLEDVKQRILEFLAVGIAKGRVSGSILCFVGPPGVGKTSIGQSIARAIGRRFYRFSVGGMRDEAEIKGHRRTYIGALPGKFVQAIKTCGSANPVIMLDEVDKIGASYQGDPASALLEVLDPEQNRDFLDHYLDVRFDLSNVFFICTANQVDTIPRPLLDRMEAIHLAGYILPEKLQIARRHLLPKLLEAHGVRPAQLRIGDDALRAIVDDYAREPGVRGLEQALRKIVRKAVKGLVEKKASRYAVRARDVAGYLGRRRYAAEDRWPRPRPGVARGLAWTSLGGETLWIEATAVPAAKPAFKQTGQLGSVMVESSEIAYTFVRAFVAADEAARGFFDGHFVHLHVPAGATPKDGPSAGVTMAAALYSLALGRPLRGRFAMTGELTLTGRVMPVGGIKEKAIAARRAGIADLILPEANRPDFEELPAHIRRGMKPRYASGFADVVALCGPAGRGRARTGEGAGRLRVPALPRRPARGAARAKDRRSWRGGRAV